MERFILIERAKLAAQAARDKIQFANRVMQESNQDPIFYYGAWSTAGATMSIDAAMQGKPLMSAISYGVGSAITAGLAGAELYKGYKTRKEIENNDGPISSETVQTLTETIDQYLALSRHHISNPFGQSRHFLLVDQTSITLSTKTEEGRRTDPRFGAYNIDVSPIDAPIQLHYQLDKAETGEDTFTVQRIQRQRGLQVHSSKRVIAEFEGRQLVRILKNKLEQREKKK
jgi:hypothetical protein